MNKELEQKLKERYDNIKSGNKQVDYEGSCGYYISKWIRLPYFIEAKMITGHIGIYELLSVKFYRDPKDMVESSTWFFVGYKDCPSIAECKDFEEFKKFYGDSLYLTEEQEKEYLNKK